MAVTGAERSRVESVVDVPDGAFDFRRFLRGTTRRPGVYRMLGAAGAVLYVGKAKNLRRRLASYFRPARELRLQALVEQIRSIEVTVTHTEAEALLLENTLIKRFQPRYNVLLRDDKSYPYIYLSNDSRYPRLAFYRGRRREAGRYFGPYPSAGAVRDTLNLMQRLFPVRQCEDGFFRNRSRPCLQYQIKRCCGPCVGLVDAETYQAHVHDAVFFLEGKSDALLERLIGRMERASERQQYEQAAHWRDMIARLRRVLEKQSMHTSGGDRDVVAASAEGGMACVQVFFVRAGRNLGNKAFYPKVPLNAAEAEVLEASLPQYYLGREVPPLVAISHRIGDRAVLEQTLGAACGHRVRIVQGGRGVHGRWMEMALVNAREALARQLVSRMGMAQRLEQMRDALDLDAVPLRIECFDVSHTMGEAAMASCVVFDQNGPVKAQYRRFHIRGIEPGDDYGALYQALTRRYTKVKEAQGAIPDLLLIDGGRGQVGRAQTVLEELQLMGVQLFGIAKGPARRPGAEQLWAPGAKRPIVLPPDAPALHLIQQIRDEAHRFAITGHRRRRQRTRTTSMLEEIPGLGPKRRQRLLKAFGGLREVSRAGVDDLVRVQGISAELARRIYESFHVEGH